MTSSSDPRQWAPRTLGGAAGAPARRPALLQPAFDAIAVPGTDVSWLPSLRGERESRELDRVSELTEAARRHGYEEAARIEAERARSALQAVARVADHLESISAAFAHDRERDLHGLAIAVARQLVQHELTIDPLRVGELVRRALELLPLDTSLEIRLNPEDLRTLGAAVELLLPGRQVSLNWVADPSIDRGGFVVENPHRIIDGRADVALRNLYERLERD